MSNYISPENADTDKKYREKLDINYLFNSQIQRCLAYAGSPVFPDHVLALQRLLPASSFHTIQNQSDMWSYETSVFEFEAPCGMPIGSIQDPCMKNQSQPVKRLEDGSIDWNDSNILSPKRLEPNTVVEYSELFRAILNEAENIGILWNLETYTEIRKTNPSKPQKNPTRRKTQ